MMKSAYELEREANIAKNRALLEELDLKDAVSKLGLPAYSGKGKGKSQAVSKTIAKPVQPAKREKRVRVEENGPRRQSTRLKKEVIDPNESPTKKRKRERDLEIQRKREEEERLEAEARAREAKRPRHRDLDMPVLAENMTSSQISSFMTAMQVVTQTAQSRGVGDPESFAFDNDKKEKSALEELREKIRNLKIVARAKVTQDRIYSAAYHPEVSKDLIFFGDKHGQLGIWDAKAIPDEIQDEDGEATVSSDNQHDGKVWRLQPHWPATSKSSISCVKFDPIDCHTIFTSAYDCTIRSLSLGSGISREIYYKEEILISSLDISPAGYEMWISDAAGGLTHLDLREDKSKARRFELSLQKIGCVSVNPTNPFALLTASNDRTLKLWDTRKLGEIVDNFPNDPPSASRSPAPMAAEGVREVEVGTVHEFLASKRGKGCLLGEFPHPNSVSAAYWDPRGRSIVSTSYDDNLRLWDVDPVALSSQSPVRSFKPFSRVSHNCQTGRWLTIFKAQWSPNADIYPHFTIGNMDHSLDVYSCKGDLVARLSNRNLITAVQAVTCSHPKVVERAASGNASGRCVLWAPQES